MPRQRKKGPDAGEQRPRRRPTPSSELELSEEERLAIADEGVDPEVVDRLEREHATTEQEASEHDRDTVREDLEGLVAEAEEQ